jgi:predicted DNA-binding transcriptional regulator AlpA
VTIPCAAPETAFSCFRDEISGAEETARRIPPAELPDALAELERLRLVLDTARIEAAVRDSRTEAVRDRVLNIHEAAERLGRSESYLYREAHRLPFTVRSGRAVGFSERGIEEWIRRGGVS